MYVYIYIYIHIHMIYYIVHGILSYCYYPQEGPGYAVRGFWVDRAQVTSGLTSRIRWTKNPELKDGIDYLLKDLGNNSSYTPLTPDS